MAERIIPLADLRYAATLPRIPDAAPPPTGLLTDALGRPLRDLRISVTDRCNFRCRYCMPAEIFGPGYAFLPDESLLGNEEIARLVRVFLPLGLKKVRLTGGEPLLRRDIAELVAILASYEAIEDLAGVNAADLFIEKTTGNNATITLIGDSVAAADAAAVVVEFAGGGGCCRC